MTAIMSWYVLHVETGQENVVRAMIRKFYNPSSMYAIVPKRRLLEKRQGHIYEVCRTIFPGYVFVNTEMNAKTYNDLRRLPKCYRLLNNFNHRYHQIESKEIRVNPEDRIESYSFSKIDDEEMRPILQLIDKDEIIGYSSLYLRNTRAVVCDGPLTGEEERIKKIDARKKRARIILRLNGAEKYIDVGIKIVSVSENAQMNITPKNQSEAN
ncbi:antiterminator LoaP [Paenibacillus alvei]|uniref:antiterminator LoaP n=2 Tax=Paenibacillus TaxID=44249 RepID=UPI003D30329A